MITHIGEKRRNRLKSSEKVNIEDFSIKNTKVKTTLNIWIGARLKELRKNGEFTVAEFANSIGISRVSLINIEKGNQTVSSKDIFNASRLLCVTPAEFFPVVDPNGEYITLSDYHEKFGLTKLTKL